MLWRIPTSNLWGPWSEFDSLRRELGRVLNEAASGSGEFPAVNIWLGDDEAVLTAELPGIDASKLDITVKDDTVTISGRREQVELGENQRYVRRERGAGEFTRSFELPFALEADGVTAKYENGVLKLFLPRAEQDRPRRISVNAG